MSWFTRLFGREQKNETLKLFREIYGGQLSKSGVTVNVDTALQVTTVLACARVLANGVAQIPWRPYRDVQGGKKVAAQHPVYELLTRRPNGWQTSFEFRETVMFHLVLTNNAFVFVNRVGIERKVKELIPIEPARVTVKREADYSLSYTVRADDGKEQKFPAEAIWHLRGPSWNSWMGMDAIRLARNAIGLSIALEETQADFHKNGAKVGGLLSVKDSLGPEKYDFLAKWLDQYEIGGARHGKPMILDLDAKFTSMGMSGVDAQHLETRKHQVEEICRAMNVMPIMVGYSDKAATYASAEQMFLAHVVHTLSPWYSRIEQSGDVNLLSDEDRQNGFYTKFTPNALMRGAAKDRADFYAKALGSGNVKGWMTQNEVRDFEELDRSDDPEADKLPQPPAKADPTPAPTGATP